MGTRGYIESNHGKMTGQPLIEVFDSDVRGLIERTSHPDIVKLYDDMEDLIYRMFHNVDIWEGKKESEVRDIIRQNLVSNIGQLWMASPYFNKQHPLYLEPKKNR